VGAQSRRLKHWGWGYEDEQLSGEELRGAAGFLVGHLGFGSADPEFPVPLDSVSLPAPRLRAPDSLSPICSSDLYQRALHTCGSSYRDVVRAVRGEFEHPPDVVARPRTEDEIVSVLEVDSISHSARIQGGATGPGWGLGAARRVLWVARGGLRRHLA
jgi:alkyldihydroxyacetonephosphate synthase